MHSDFIDRYADVFEIYDQFDRRIDVRKWCLRMGLFAKVCEIAHVACYRVLCNFVPF